MEELKDERAITVDIDDIDAEGGLALAFERPMKIFFPNEETAEGALVKASLNISKYGDNVYVTGTASGNVKLQCGRCLSGYAQKLAPRLGGRFVPWADVEKDEEVSGYDGEAVDLFPLLHDGLVMEIPIKPLCSEHCKGLCPKCGVDMNKIDCGCKRGAPDARFAVLQKLRDKLT